MANRVLTAKLKAEALNNGMELIGFAPVSRWKNAPFLISPQAVLPDSKFVVVCGIHITDTWTEMGGEPHPQDVSPGGWMDQNSLLDRTAYRLVRLLEDHGERAIGVASSNIWRYREIDDIGSPFAPDLSHMHAATAAGITELGWNGLAISPEFGPRVRYISVVTTAELETTPMYDGPVLCDKCMDCVRCCPSYAMKKDMNGKPHVVEIEDKVYKYANKNIWRCAWAEHFNLNLDSDTLEQDHVNEDTILEEIAAKGTRGHERGVCQKVCVPPHLRSDEPSFGRPDKQITLNRINRRYPDTMPTLRKMRDDIIARMVEMGADIVNVRPLVEGSEEARQVSKEAPGMKTIIAVAMRIPSETRDEKHNSYSDAPYHYALYHKMHHMLLRTAVMVEDYGYYGASYTAGLHKETRLPKRLAAMGGVGVLEDGLIRTSEYGTDVIVGAVCTDAELDELPQIDALSAKTEFVAPSPKRLRRRLEQKAEENLVSLFGIADAKLFGPIVEDLRANVDQSDLGSNIHDGHWGCHGAWESKISNEKVSIAVPGDYVDGAQSVIVLGMHFPEALINNSGEKDTMQIGTYGYWNYQTVYELYFAAMELARELNRYGYNTFVTTNMLGIGSKVDSPRGPLPDSRCGAIEAMVAGIGEVGKNGSLLTAEFGCHQRQIMIITDAPIPTDEPYDGETLCTDCGNCQSRCPMQAYGESFDVRVDGHTVQIPGIQRNRCDWAKRYSLHRDEGPALIGNTTHVEPPAGQITISMLAEACEKKDPVMKKRSCVLEPCLKHCPAGR